MINARRPSCLASLILLFGSSGLAATSPSAMPSVEATVIRYQSGMSFAARLGAAQECVSLLGLFAHDIAPRQLAIALAPGRQVLLLADPEAPVRDEGGCLLRYVRLESGEELNASLLQQGAAVIDGRYPFSRRGEFDELARQAREARAGVWGEPGVGPHEDIKQRDAEPFFAGIGQVTNPVLSSESRTPPTYPQRPRHEGVEGRSVLQIVVRKDGSVGEMVVLATQLVFKDGSHKTIEQPRDSNADYGFGDASTRAVKTWRYRPATLDGRPVDVFFTVVVDFALDLPRTHSSSS